MQDLFGTFQIFVVLFDTVQASASSDDNSTARIAVGWPAILIVEILLDSTVEALSPL
jgi:hypothetical protein